jgi:hypothetical protein
VPKSIVVFVPCPGGITLAVGGAVVAGVAVPGFDVDAPVPVVGTDVSAVADVVAVGTVVAGALVDGGRAPVVVGTVVPGGAVVGVLGRVDAGAGVEGASVVVSCAATECRPVEVLVRADATIKATATRSPISATVNTTVGAPSF